MKQIQHILVPTDFSDAAENALSCAKVLSGACQANLHLLFVDNDPILNAPTTDQRYRDDYEDKMALRFDGLFTREEREQFDVHFAVKSGDASVQILDYVKDHDIDLIVMGTQGRSAVMDAILGSVAHRVMAQSPVPVVSVRTPRK